MHCSSISDIAATHSQIHRTRHTVAREEAGSLGVRGARGGVRLGNRPRVCAAGAHIVVDGNMGA